jgi:hypothetical protein
MLCLHGVCLRWCAVLCHAVQVVKAESVLTVDESSSRALRLINVLNLYIVNEQGQVCSVFCSV